jgi:hypothetical protein
MKKTIIIEFEKIQEIPDCFQVNEHFRKNYVGLSVKGETIAFIEKKAIK